jgi:hypothetical protein
MAMADCHGRNSNSWFAKKKGVKIRMLTTLKLHALLRRHLDSTDSLAFSPRNSHSLNRERVMRAKISCGGRADWFCHGLLCAYPTT